MEQKNQGGYESAACVESHYSTDDPIALVSYMQEANIRLVRAEYVWKLHDAKKLLPGGRKQKVKALMAQVGGKAQWWVWRRWKSGLEERFRLCFAQFPTAGNQESIQTLAATSWNLLPKALRGMQRLMMRLSGFSSTTPLSSSTSGTPMKRSTSGVAWVTCTSFTVMNTPWRWGSRAWRLMTCGNSLEEPATKSWFIMSPAMAWRRWPWMSWRKIWFHIFCEVGASRSSNGRAPVATAPAISGLMMQTQQNLKARCLCYLQSFRRICNRCSLPIGRIRQQLFAFKKPSSWRRSPDAKVQASPM